jgi:hypothetical protein
MAHLENSHKTLQTIIDQIESGDIKIPQFQREFVWEVSASARLVDSILKNYPIGSFIYWRTDKELRFVKDVGNLSFKSKSSGEKVNYVLDGQQRITSIYASIKGAQIPGRKKVKDFSKIWINLDATEDDEVVVNSLNGLKSFISLSDLYQQNYWDVPQEYREKIKKYFQTLVSYQFTGTSIQDASTNVSTEIFTRLNTGGKPLTNFQIMCAATYDSDLNFDLQEKYDELKKSLNESNYDIDPSQVLQFISILLTHKGGFTGGCTNKFILDLNKREFINVWNESTNNIKAAVDYIRTNLCPTYKFLPYSATIVLFAYFFNKSKKMSSEQKKMMDDLFWRVSLGLRYNAGLEGKLIQDIHKVDDILNEDLPKYEWSIDNITPSKLIERGQFKQSSYIKSMFCLMILQNPKSFKNNSIVSVDGNYQLSKNSINIHHFFPKKFLSKEGVKETADHILNMTIIDDNLNKEISDKAPNLYIQKFLDSNENLNESLKTHLIGDIDSFGITSNDYEKFKMERAKLLSQEILNRIIPQETGNELQDTETEEEVELIED